MNFEITNEKNPQMSIQIVKIHRCFLKCLYRLMNVISLYLKIHTKLFIIETKLLIFVNDHSWFIFV